MGNCTGKGLGEECTWHISGNRVGIDLAGERVPSENKQCEMIKLSKHKFQGALNNS